jgi:hypothetical protein
LIPGLAPAGKVAVSVVPRTFTVIVSETVTVPDSAETITVDVPTVVKGCVAEIEVVLLCDAI